MQKRVQTVVSKFQKVPTTSLVYPSLRAANDIRVVCIQPGHRIERLVCEISTASLDDPELSYIALSYTWGTSANLRSITCNGSRLSLTANLESALQHLRDRKEIVTYWIDQICINQDDLDERGHQVGLMPRIYSQARQVKIWLGDETATTKAAFQLMHYMLDTLVPRGIYRSYDTEGHRELVIKRINIDDLPRYGLPARTQKDWQGLAEVFTLPWFSRVWVIQEAVMARDAMVLCGKYTLSWKQLVRVAQASYVFLPRMVLGVELALKGWPIDHVRGLHNLKKARKHAVDPGMFALIARHKISYHASDPRDKFYALCNLTGQGTAEADYAVPEEQVFHRLACDLLRRFVLLPADPSPEELMSLELYFPELPHTRRGRLMALICLAGSAFQTHSLLPSWVPDLAVSVMPMPILSRQRKGWSHVGGADFVLPEFVPSAPLDPEGNLPRVLAVQGFICDVIREVGTVIVGLEKPLEQDEQQQALSSWFVEASMIASRVWKPTASDVDTMEERFVSVLLMGRRTEEFLSIDENESASDGKVSILRFSQTAEHKGKMHHHISSQDYQQSLPNVQGRVFFVTEVNSTGLAPPTTRQGDQVAVFSGCDVPVILRAYRDGGYVLVGECCAEMDVKLPRKATYNDDIHNSKSGRTREWQKILLF